MSAPKALKPLVSDFGGQFHVYSVATDEGWAFKGNGLQPDKYERAVDIGSDLDWLLPQMNCRNFMATPMVCA